MRCPIATGPLKMTFGPVSTGFIEIRMVLDPIGRRWTMTAVDGTLEPGRR
jgi:hypothetical protein